MRLINRGAKYGKAYVELTILGINTTRNSLRSTLCALRFFNDEFNALLQDSIPPSPTILVKDAKASA